MNGCTGEHIEKFAAFPFENKILINNRKNTKYPFEFYIEGFDGKEDINNDTQPFPGKIKIKNALKSLDKYGGRKK